MFAVQLNRSDRRFYPHRRFSLRWRTRRFIRKAPYSVSKIGKYRRDDRVGVDTITVKIKTKKSVNTSPARVDGEIILRFLVYVNVLFELSYKNFLKSCEVR